LKGTKCRPRKKAKKVFNQTINDAILKNQIGKSIPTSQWTQEILNELKIVFEENVDYKSICSQSLKKEDIPKAAQEVMNSKYVEKDIEERKDFDKITSDYALDFFRCIGRDSSV